MNSDEVVDEGLMLHVWDSMVSWDIQHTVPTFDVARMKLISDLRMAIEDSQEGYLRPLRELLYQVLEL